jgi:hypothetical protein
VISPEAEGCLRWFKITDVSVSYCAAITSCQNTDVMAGEYGTATSVYFNHLSRL